MSPAGALEAVEPGRGGHAFGHLAQVEEVRRLRMRGGEAGRGISWRSPNAHGRDLTAGREPPGRLRPVASRVMSTADEKPMSGTAFLVMTVLMVLGALFLLRWFLSTVAFLFNTLILVALIAGAVFLYMKARGRT